MNQTRASRTALLIAESLCFTRGDPALASMVPGESVQLARAVLAVVSPRRERLHRWLGKPGLRWVVRAAEAAVLPGIQLHYALRKRYLHDQAVRAVDAGVRQVVVVGAGFDALALRLSRRPERIACIEVDHPATQAVKRAALARIGPTAGRLRLVAADLAREPLADALVRADFDPTVRTLFVAEGLTMYLEEENVKELLASCAERAPPESRFAWTFMAPDAEGRIGFHHSRRGLVDAWLRARNEPFSWGIPPDEVVELIRPLGLDLVEIAGDEELRSRYLAPLEIHRALASGEYLCVVQAR